MSVCLHVMFGPVVSDGLWLTATKTEISTAGESISLNNKKISLICIMLYYEVRYGMC